MSGPGKFDVAGDQNKDRLEPVSRRPCSDPGGACLEVRGLVQALAAVAVLQSPCRKGGPLLRHFHEMHLQGRATDGVRQLKAIGLQAQARQFLLPQVGQFRHRMASDHIDSQPRTASPALSVAFATEEAKKPTGLEMTFDSRDRALLVHSDNARVRQRQERVGWFRRPVHYGAHGRAGWPVHAAPGRAGTTWKNCPCSCPKPPSQHQRRHEP